MFEKAHCVFIGKLQKAHNLYGQLVLTSDIELPEKSKKEPILIDIDGGLVPFFIATDGYQFKDHHSQFVKLEDVDSKEEAESLIGLDVYVEKLHVEKEGLEPQEEDPAFLEGCILETDEGVVIGKIESILDYSGNILLKVVHKEKEFLIPYIEENILEVRHVDKRLVMVIPEGLLDIF